MQEDLDLIAHLGDYIYEGAAATGESVRKHNSREIETLDEYRNRHALYKTDRLLQAAHAACPWLVTWDDHEFSDDAHGAVAIPGLIDTHAHVVFADWTPRQNTIGWIESSMHGGVTMMMSASEVHLPGRPSDREGVKALALLAHRTFSVLRPGGVKVLGGSVIIEPTLEPEDFDELATLGVGLAKVGFGAFDRPADAAPLVRAAQHAGMIVMNHTGGASIPGRRAACSLSVLRLSQRTNACSHPRRRNRVRRSR